MQKTVQSAESHAPIIGVWRALWTNRPNPESYANSPYLCEYTAGGELIQEVSPWPNGDRAIYVLKCEYYENRVRHFYKPNQHVDFSYVVKDDILEITDPKGWIWHLKRIDDPTVKPQGITTRELNERIRERREAEGRHTAFEKAVRITNDS